MEKAMYKYANAPAYKPKPTTDRHCLYLTFSNGFPLTEIQILNFFNKNHSPFVADVFVYRRKGVQPLFGKVVFKHTDSPDLIMQNRGKAFFNVDGCPLWCRRWDSKKKGTTASASNSTGDGGSHHGGDQ